MLAELGIQKQWSCSGKAAEVFLLFPGGFLVGLWVYSEGIALLVGEIGGLGTVEEKEGEMCSGVCPISSPAETHP